MARKGFSLGFKGDVAGGDGPQISGFGRDVPLTVRVGDLRDVARQVNEALPSQGEYSYKAQLDTLQKAMAAAQQAAMYLDVAEEHEARYGSAGSDEYAELQMTAYDFVAAIDNMIDAVTVLT